MQERGVEETDRASQPPKDGRGGTTMNRSLTALFQLALTAGIVVFGLASGVLLVANGPTLEFAKAAGLLCGCLALLLVTERVTTGRWTKWSRR
jgi:hypothetical protein